MADRRTSVAKDVLEARIDSALERYGLAQEAFDHARRDDPSISHENAHLRESSMVSNDRPQHNPRPDPKIARPVDREAFNERWSQEQLAAERDQDRDMDRDI